MSKEQARALIEFGNHVALMGHLSLLALDVLDPESAVRARR